MAPPTVVKAVKAVKAVKPANPFALSASRVFTSGAGLAGIAHAYNRLAGSVLASMILMIGPAAAETSDNLPALKRAYTRPADVPFPESNPKTAAKIALGKTLFFDPRLSGTNETSCATCHIPALGWEDGQRLTESTSGGSLKRHTPTLWNLAWGRTFFWDGRVRSLEAQAIMPIRNDTEMNQSVPALLAELRAIESYRDRFRQAFPDSPRITESTLTRAIATYERTLVQPPTPFDVWVNGDADAIGAAAKRGFRLFNGKARCATCHSGWNFTAGAFHDIGLPDNTGDKGRGPVLGIDAANHAFKTPTLRDVARRAPYMHDGSLPNLQAVIAHYEGGFVQRESLSADMQAIDLTVREEADLIAFLHTLTTPAEERNIEPPEIPSP